MSVSVIKRNKERKKEKQRGKNGKNEKENIQVLEEFLTNVVRVFVIICHNLWSSIPAAFLEGQLIEQQWCVLRVVGFRSILLLILCKEANEKFVCNVIKIRWLCWNHWYVLCLIPN